MKMKKKQQLTSLTTKKKKQEKKKLYPTSKRDKNGVIERQNRWNRVSWNKKDMNFQATYRKWVDISKFNEENAKKKRKSGRKEEERAKKKGSCDQEYICEDGQWVPVPKYEGTHAWVRKVIC